MPRRIAYFKPPSPKYRTAAEKERAKFYNSAAWRRLRAAFLAANPVCVDCEHPALIADHIIERLTRPDQALSWDNLRALCGSCHTRRHKTTGHHPSTPP